MKLGLGMSDQKQSKLVFLSIYLFCTVFTNTVHAAGLIEDTLKELRKKSDPAAQLLSVGIQEWQKKLANLEQEKNQLSTTESEFKQTTDKQLREINALLGTIYRELKEEGKEEDEFLTTYRSLLTKRADSLREQQRERENLIRQIQEHIALLKGYLDNPKFEQFKKENKLEEHEEGYPFEEVQRINRLITDHEKTLTYLLEQEKNAIAERESRKKSLTTSTDAIKQLEALSKQSASDKKNSDSKQLPDDFGFTKDQQQKLNSAQEKLTRTQHALFELRFKESEHYVGLVKTKIFIENPQIDLLKEYGRRVKEGIKIREVDLAQAKELLTKKIQEAAIKKETYRREIEYIESERKKREAALAEFAQKVGVSLGHDIDEWEKQPDNTVASYSTIYQIGKESERIQLLDAKKSSLVAHINAEEQHIQYETLITAIKETLYMLASDRQGIEDIVIEDKKKYEVARSQARAGLASFNTNKNSITDDLNIQKKSLDSLKAHQSRFELLKTTVFSDHTTDFLNVSNFLASALRDAQSQIDLFSQTIVIYVDIISILNALDMQLTFVLSRLEEASLWRRSEDAISWTGIKQSLTDMERFATGINRYILSFKVQSCINAFNRLLQHKTNFLLFLFKIIGLIILLMGLRKLFFYLYQSFMVLAVSSVGITKKIIFFITSILNLYNRHFMSLSLWITLCIYTQKYITLDPYPAILFYLMTLGYWLYIFSRFMRYLIALNKEYDHQFFSQEFEDKELTIITLVGYSTLWLVLLSTAFGHFMRTGYYRSELPAVLLALNYILIQTAVIFLCITRERLLAIIPRRSELGDTLYGLVNRYYYLIVLILVAIVVMINPKIGFGKLVVYMLACLAYTIGLLWSLLVIYRGCKRIAWAIFFEADHGAAKERFDYAKTGFGFFMLLLLCTLFLTWAVFTLRIWGYVIELTDIKNWLGRPLLLKDSATPLTMISVFYIIGFVLAGLIASFIADRFILDKIFDLLFVEAGVQNTIESITRYIIVTASILIGFQSVGLGVLVSYAFGALILSIGWVLKDPIGDFIAYFIILVQRPVKIGDYVRIDEQTMGVVRKINSRTVILRRKNSVTIIVPNTKILNASVVNWNYSRSFVAIDDIILTTVYNVDPEFVRSTILVVLEQNVHILKNPKPIIRLDDFSERGYVFTVRGFLSADYTLQRWSIASDIRFALVAAFNKNNIKLAVPVRIIMQETEQLSFGNNDKDGSHQHQTAGTSFGEDFEGK